ncbi:hypothetical protein ABZU93_31500, partial [Micromonospora zamorensis]
LANDALGSPLRWRLLAEHNRITDPLSVPAGTTLAVPPPGAPTGGSVVGGVSGAARALAGAVGAGASFVGASIATAPAAWGPTGPTATSTNPGGTP